MSTLVSLSQDPILRFTYPDGTPLVGGTLTTLVGGIPYPTYSESTGTTALPNPIVLNDRGEIATQVGTSSPLFVNPNVAYTYILQDVAANTIWTAPNIVAAATTASVLTLLTQTLLGQILYPQTPAEIAAGVVPTNYQYPWGNVLRYGAYNDTTHAAETTAAINAALQVAGFGGAAVYLPAGIYAVNADLIVPMGIKFLQGGDGPFAASMYGDGKEQTEIRFVAGGVITNGVFLDGGATFKLGGVIRDLMINGNRIAPQGLTLSFADITTVRDVIVRACTGRGIYVDNCIMTRLEQVFVAGNGSADSFQVEIDGTLIGSTGGTTTTVLEQVYISGITDAATLGGLSVDRANNTTIVGGAIESTGPCGLAVSSKQKVDDSGPETHACAGFSIIGVDFENITDHFIELGYGLTDAYVAAFTASNCTGQPSNAATTPYAVKMNFTNGPRFTNCAWAQPGAPTCTYWMEGPNPLRVTIDAHPANAGAAYPWVMSNGNWVKSASPLVQYNSNFSPTDPLKSQKAVTGTTWSVLVNANQGGWYEQLGAANVAPTNVTTLTDASSGMRVYIKGDGQSTLKQGTGTNQFNNTAGADLLLASNQYYIYMFNGVYWVQL